MWKTDNTKINKLISNAIWGQKGNFLDVPTDCPQRDERLGWTADAQVFSNSACFNMDAYIFYKKYIKDLKFDQEIYYDGDFPMWSPSLKLQCNAGDKNLLNNNYEMIKKYVEVLKQKDSNEGNKHLITKGFCYGNWLALDGINEVSTNGGTDTDFVMNIYYYHIVDIASKVANELGKTELYFI